MVLRRRVIDMFEPEIAIVSCYEKSDIVIVMSVAIIR